MQHRVQSSEKNLKVADRRRNVSSRYRRERWDGFLEQDERGMLLVEGVPVDALAKGFGTPLYIMVESEIRSRLRRFRKVFGPETGLQYAVKCNSNLEILRIVREEGFELDCSSVGELILGLLADFKPQKLTFTNLYKTEQDIHFAAQIGVQSITADSIEEIERIAKTARKLQKHVNTVLRVNPMIEMGNYSTKDNKYGIPLRSVEEAVALVQKSPFVDFKGFHFMGGYVSSPRIYKAAARAMVKIISRVYAQGIRVESLSLGGGFPAAIGDAYAFPIEDMKDFPRYFKRLLERHNVPPLRLIFEPGKSIVLNAGIGLVEVVSKKKLGRSRHMVVTDGSTYNFVPDALVQDDLKYDVLPASKLKLPRVHTATIAGNTCDCWDLIVKNIEMPKLREGDLLAIMDVGGYAHVMACNFNTIKRAPMVMVRADGCVTLIRRRDRYSEMFAPELDVLKLADSDELMRYHKLYNVNIDKIWKGKQQKRQKQTEEKVLVEKDLQPVKK
jgi:diaminopimelate decarboxylase